jgi:hypothetical protein
LDGKIKRVRRSEFLIPIAKDQWGLRWVDSMVKREMLNRFKIGNAIYLKLNEDFESDIEFVKKNYWLFIRFLTNDIKKYNLTELNEGIKDVFKPKTKEEIDNSIKLYSLDMAKELDINEDVIEFIYKMGYRLLRVDNLGNTWFTHRYLNPYEGGNYCANIYTTIDDVKKYVERLEIERKTRDYETRMKEKGKLKESIEDILKPKSREEIIDLLENYFKDKEIDLRIVRLLYDNKYLFKDVSYRGSSAPIYWFKYPNNMRDTIGIDKFTKFDKLKEKLERLDSYEKYKESLNETIILYCGGFKPLTGAHISVVEAYANHPSVKKIILFVSPKDRGGIDCDTACDIINEILNEYPIEIIVDNDSYSPILAAYRWIEKLDREPGKYAIASSTKDEDYKRVRGFLESYTSKEFRKNLPIGVEIIEFPIKIDPLLYENGKPISSTNVRKALEDNNYKEFKKSYPNLPEEKIKRIWNKLTKSKDIEEAGNTEFTETEGLSGYSRTYPSQKYKSIKNIEECRGQQDI